MTPLPDKMSSFMGTKFENDGFLPIFVSSLLPLGFDSDVYNIEKVFVSGTELDLTFLEYSLPSWERRCCIPYVFQALLEKIFFLPELICE